MPLNAVLSFDAKPSSSDPTCSTVVLCQRFRQIKTLTAWFTMIDSKARRLMVNQTAEWAELPLQDLYFCPCPPCSYRLR